MKLFLLVGVGLLWGTTALGQTDNKYLDDAYYRRSDLRKIDKEERRKAELRRAAERAEREAWEKEQAALIATYKKNQADRELDAYNGHLTLPEDTITLTRAELGRLLKEQRSSAYRGESDPEVYGPYSSRLSRFYGSGSMTIQGARRVYIDADPWYSDLDYRYAGSDVYVRVGSRDPYWGSRYGWGASWGWGSWYDPYYSYGSYWGYPRYYGSWYGGYYDPYYYGYYRGYYGGYYGSGYGYGYGSYYDYYPGYYYGYAAGAATRAYREHYYNNPYSHGASSGSRRSGYSAYSSVRDGGYINAPRSYDQYSTDQDNRGYWDASRRQQERRQEPQRTYDYYPQRSYDRSASQSNSSQNSGGGGSTTPPRRR